MEIIKKSKGSICNLVISVSDTGMGIKKENMDKLFNKFERLDAPINSTISGAGLGLAITKNLIDMMNGKIKVQSMPNKGTTFEVTIPQKMVRKGAKRSIESIFDVVDEAINAKECLDFVSKNKYDIILMDIMMPEMDGVETLKKLKEEVLNLLK